MMLAPITIAIHTFGQDGRKQLVADVRAGLAGKPRSLPPRWFYDERGSALFEAITRLPEYYLTRTEAEILSRVAGDVVDATHPEMIVELGAGSAEKTRILIEAGLRDRLSSFVPFDVSEQMLQDSARRLATDFPSLSVYAVVGSFGEHLDRVPRHGKRLVVFLGSTVGNFDDEELTEFLASVRLLLQPGDSFLIGIDLLKDEGELLAAYNDTQGVTAQFNLNVLRVVNRELDADFDLEGFEHVALFNRERSRIEMYLRALRDQRVRIPGADLWAEFCAGELLLTEISTKFTRESIQSRLAASGLSVARWYTDPESRFAVCLCFGPETEEGRR
jgi:L-histidine N-alpha-methyltransferase